LGGEGRLEVEIKAEIVRDKKGKSEENRGLLSVSLLGRKDFEKSRGAHRGFKGNCVLTLNQRRGNQWKRTQETKGKKDDINIVGCG